MGIQTIHGEYLIIKKVYSDDSFEINLCKSEEDEEEEKLYTVITLKNQEVIRSTTGIFSSLRQNHEFADFIECFSRDSYLYIVFLYYDEVPLNFEDIGDKPVMERVEVIKQLLSLIIILNIPTPIIYDVLSKENINFDASGKVYFNYFLKRIDKYNNLKNSDCLRKMGFIIGNIFSEELQDNHVEGLNEFVDKCKNAQYKNMMDLYSDYVNLYDSFVRSLSIAKETKLSWLKQMMNKILYVFNKLTPLLIMLALCIGIVYLIVDFTSDTKKQNPTKIKSIGTIQIDQKK